MHDINYYLRRAQFYFIKFHSTCKICEVFNLTTGLEVIPNLWRCSGSLVIKMVQNYLKKNNKESKIKEIIFKDFLIKLPRPSKQ